MTGVADAPEPQIGHPAAGPGSAFDNLTQSADNVRVGRPFVFDEQLEGLVARVQRLEASADH